MSLHMTQAGGRGRTESQYCGNSPLMRRWALFAEALAPRPEEEAVGRLGPQKSLPRLRSMI
jgi:hypothetical protein